MSNKVVKIKQRKGKRRQRLPGLGGALGDVIGGAIAGPIGALVGRKLGELGASITGVGAYTVKYNALVPGRGVPTFTSFPQSKWVSQTEHIGDVVGSVGFDSTTYSINPGNSEVFRKLSNDARTREQYRFHGLIFYFNSTVTEFAKSGVVTLAAQYDVHDAPFSDMTEMLGYQYAVSGKPSEDLLAPIECDPKLTGQDWYYVSMDNYIEIDKDEALMDFCNFTVATQGQDDTDVIGQLWCSYVCEMIVPKDPEAIANIPVATNVLQYYCNAVDHSSGVAVQIGGSEIIDPEPWVYLSGAGRLFEATSIDAAGFIKLPPGVYRLHFQTTFQATDATTTVNVLKSFKFQYLNNGVQADFSFGDFRTAIDSTTTSWQHTLSGEVLVATVYSDPQRAFGVEGTTAFSAGTINMINNILTIVKVA